jgi:hypothetical protein
MSVSPGGVEASRWTRVLFGWASALASKLAPSGELQGIGRQEFEHIARDLNLSTAELYVLTGKSGLTGDLLRRRLAEFRLSAEQVRDSHPDVLRDLERVCGNCVSTGRCARESFDAASADARSGYCPNTPTLRDLQAESHADASLPIGPSCC